MKGLSWITRSKVFFLVWLGQVLSISGSELTSFALGVWILETTGSPTRYALVFFCSTMPVLLLSPLAGAVVDRRDRRSLMIAADSGAALGTLLLATLYLLGLLEPWHIYLAAALGAVCGTFQQPAWLASTTLLVPREHLGRANGLNDLAAAVGGIAAPAMAGFLLLTIHVEGILLTDLATYGFAIAMLLMVRFPSPLAKEPLEKEIAVKGAGAASGTADLWRDLTFGLRFLFEHPTFLKLVGLSAIINLVSGMVSVLVAPLVLSFADAPALGLVFAASAAGGLAGSLVMSAWGGPRRMIHGVLGFIALAGIAISLGALHPSALLLAASLFLTLASIQILNACSTTLWQRKVNPAIQGRVFATRRWISWSTLPLAYLSVGPLVEQVLEPMMAPGGRLAAIFGTVVGVGAGRGMALLFLLMGTAWLVAAAIAALDPRLRHIEDEIPDAPGS